LILKRKGRIQRDKRNKKNDTDLEPPSTQKERVYLLGNDKPGGLVEVV